MCLAHYKADWYQRHKPAPPLVRKPLGRPKKTTVDYCTVAGCARVASGRGFCTLHWKRWYKTGDPLGIRVYIQEVTPPEERFWALVDKRGPDDCWPWTGALTPGQYGSFRLSREKTISAHHYSWALVYGPKPADKGICHTCSGRYPPGDRTNRRCVNPAHLYLGTHRQNTDDMVRDRRQAIGVRQADAKLTDAAVRKIRASGTQRDRTAVSVLAARFGVSTSTIRDVLKQRTWKHVL